MNGPKRSPDFRNASANLVRSGIRHDKYTRLFADRFLQLDGTGVMLMDNEFCIVEISDMIGRLFGLENADWIDCPVEEWFDRIGWKPHPFDRTLLGGQAIRNRSFDWGEGETRRSIMLDGDVLQERETGEIAGAFVLFRDVSHLMLLEEQIRRSDRLKTIGQIAAGTAHEIRNPLTAIKGFMQLLNKSVTDRHMVKEQEFVSIMMSELDRVNELVSEFLLLSKPKEVQLVSITAGAVLQEILPVIRNEALLHGVIVRYDPKPGFPPVLVDKEQLKQVFLNLAKNAIEAMSGGGILLIRERLSRDKPGQIAVVIRDTGPGIPPEVLQKIFDPFFTTKPQGTGLGLSICQRIVHDLGGDLEVASDTGGTCFTVRLPTGVS
jgi:two-component system, sporulation sensor kinase E